MTTYPINIFRRAIADNSRITSVRYTEFSGKVQRVDGTVMLLRRVVVNGQPRIVHTEKKVRWDGTGRCFSPDSDVRQRKYDLPLADYADETVKEVCV